MSLEALLTYWQHTPEITENLVCRRTLGAQPAQWASLPENLHPDLKTALQQQGITALFSHQAAAWQALQNGEHIALATPTASGKTLAYNLPVLHHLMLSPDARALYLFPTKALAHDQWAALQTLWPDAPPGSMAAYDGDTPAGMRAPIRGRARILLSNPDMLHAGILPRHPDWADFFSGLRFVVLDEMHIYRGVFGSHLANLLRRLRRIAFFYGAAPQFILTSATIGNPSQLAEKMVEAPVTMLEENGAPCGEKQVWLYNPPVLDSKLGLRAGLRGEVVRLASNLLHFGVQSILFEGSRRGVEFTLNAIRQQADQPQNVQGYRSGYLPAQRRQIESGLRNGRVRMVVTTNALELGMDIGRLEAALLLGYPGTLAATWQQIGRAGRGKRPALAVLVASPGPIDQYLLKHPDYLFSRSPEHALINPDNPLILLAHLRCAAFELPFESGQGFGNLPAEDAAQYLQWMQSENMLSFRNGRYFWAQGGYPAGEVSLRATSPQRVQIETAINDGIQPIGEIDQASAPWMIHPGAIYYHRGAAFEVQSLDLEAHRALVVPFRGNFYTQPRRQSQIELLHRQAVRKIPGGKIAHGELKVTTQVSAYFKINLQTQAILEKIPLELPSQTLQSSGYWLVPAPQTVEKLRQSGNWLSDPNHYGPEWPRLREQIRRRDGFHCQICGTPESGRTHHVHHIRPFRTFSDSHQANQPGNLITLCPTCHRRAETAVRVRSGLSGLAYAMHHLAPLLLMCDTHDLGLNADPASPIADGQPAIVLYENIPAGVGFAEELYARHQTLISAVAQLVHDCACTDGCPSCTGPGGELGAGGKPETLALLNHLAPNLW